MWLGWLCLLLALTYSLLIIYLISGWNKIQETHVGKHYIPKTAISVIVCFRNEENSLRATIQHLISQDYPEFLYEVILVDDHSTDRSSQIVSSIQHPNLRYFDLKNLKGGQAITGKKDAIKYGINHSHHSLVVCTDADSLVPETWLRSIAWSYERFHFQFAALPVVMEGQHTFLDQFQALDFCGLMLLTGGGIHHRLFYSANGANLAFQKKVYYKYNGAISSHYASGDDIFLINAIAKSHPNEIVFIKNKDVIVRTPTQPDFSSFFQQRIRWGSKSKAYSFGGLSLIWILVFLTCIFLLLTFAKAALEGDYPLIFFTLMALIIKGISDYLMLHKATAFFNRKKLMRPYLPLQLFHLFYVIIIGFSSIFTRQYRWKGRKVS